MEIVDAMRVAAPGTRVAHVAARFGMSPRTLQRLFAKHVGTTPKHVLQRFRRQRAIDHLSEERRVNLARLAAELGYCDQAHLARDFRATIGRSPSAVAASRSDAPAEGHVRRFPCGGSGGLTRGSAQPAMEATNQRRLFHKKRPIRAICGSFGDHRALRATPRM